MTEVAYYMIFQFHDSFYALPVESIHEIHALPALLEPPDPPFSIKGFLNLHGNLIRIVDLGICLGLPSNTHSLNDLLVVLKGGHVLFGIVIPDALEISPLSSSNFLTLDPREGEKRLLFFSSQVVNLSSLTPASKFNTSIAYLLLPDELVKGREEQPKILDFSASCHDQPVFDMNRQEQSILASRALHLIEPMTRDDQDSFIPIIVIKIEGKYFGVAPDSVKEVINLEGFCPIPNAPPYLAGCVNFKGRPLTLIDIWPILTQETLSQTQPLDFNSDKSSMTKTLPSSQALIIQYNRILIGILVDQVMNVINFSPLDFQSIPLGIEARALGRLTQRIILYENQSLIVLDIDKIFDSITRS